MFWVGLGTAACPRTTVRTKERQHRRSGSRAQEPNADAQAIGDLLGRFIKAYNAKDAKALGELFTPDAEIEDEDGEVTRGRDAIVARFAKIFGDGQSGTLAVNDGLPALPGNRSCHRGGDGVPHDSVPEHLRKPTGTA